MVCSRCKKRPAVVFITRMEGDKTVNDGLCLTCARELGIKPVEEMLDKFGMSEDDIEQMNQQMELMMGDMNGDGEDDENGFSAGGAATFPFLQKIFGGNKADDAEESEEGESEAPTTTKSGGKKKRDKKRKTLLTYCTDLTAKARAGQMDAIIGRDREIYRVEQILCRRTKNNPCLIGEPGVGKTAIAEGLALRIAHGEVPPRLHHSGWCRCREAAGPG